MKKGFTLIELLSVLIILAIILVVAVPRILKAIDGSKVSAYISNEKLVLKSAELYVSKNISTLPANIGDTSEVLLSDLITDGYIKTVKSPFNKNDSCSGYVLITKKSSDSYDYTPHINCIDSTMVSSTQDKLLLHYKFDDFQESTTNIFSNASFENSLTHIYDGMEFLITRSLDFASDKIWAIKSVRNTTTSYGRIIVISSTGVSGGFVANQSYTVSCDVYVDQNHSATTVNISDHSGIVLNSNKNSYDMSKKGTWQKIWFSFKINSTGTSPILVVQSLNGTLTIGDTIYIDAIQIEKKTYATPYTDSTRIGVVEDYSMNNNDTQLTVDNTPKWVYSEERKSGTYVFDKTKTLINKSNVSPTVNSFTLSSWININSHSTDTNIGQIIISNYTSLKGWIFSLNGPNSKLQIRNHNGTATAYNLYTSTGLNLNTWYHVVATDDGTVVRLFLNGIQVAFCNSQPAVQEVLTLRIGSFTDTINIFDGTIDDVRIYSRALSPNEIKILYDTKK